MHKQIQATLLISIFTVMFLSGCGLQHSKTQHPSDYGEFSIEQVTSIANNHAAQATAVYANNLFN